MAAEIESSKNGEAPKLSDHKIEDVLVVTISLLNGLRERLLKTDRHSPEEAKALFAINLAIFNLELILGVK